jgi:multiple sugar transport system permease protein
MAAARPLDRQRWALTVALLALALLWLAPIAWVVVTSLKPSENIVRLPPEWIPWPATGAHYQEVLWGSSRTARIGRAFVNSLVVATGSVLVVLATSSMAAYPLARMRFPGRDLIFGILVGSLMIPNAVLLVPQYVLTQRIGWLSTYQGMIVPEAAMLFAFGVFLLRQFFLTMPGELEDAARIDGAGAWQTFWHVTFPLLTPTLLFTLLIDLIEAFQVFDTAFVLGGSRGGTRGSLLFYVLNIWNEGFRNGRFGYASALAWVLVIAAAVVIVLIFVTSKRWVYYESEGA